MLAKRKSDGKVIEVEPQRYMEHDGSMYAPSELDFNVDEEVTIDGWVARDRLNNALFLHDEKPYRSFSGYQTDGKEDEWRSDTCPPYPIDYNSFPSLTWESDPLPVTITIKPKKQ